MVSQKILSISTTPALAGRQVSGMANHQKCRTCRVGGVGIPSTSLKRYHTPARGQSTAHVAVLSRAAPGLACGRAMPGRGELHDPRCARSSAVALSW